MPVSHGYCYFSKKEIPVPIYVLISFIILPSDLFRPYANHSSNRGAQYADQHGHHDFSVLQYFHNQMYLKIGSNVNMRLSGQ